MLLDHPGLVHPVFEAHNQFMTITYANGNVSKALVLSHQEDEIRAIAAVSDDVMTFTRFQGTWISEEIDPVTIEFEGQRGGALPAPSVEGCICPKELAAYLIQTLFAGCEEEEASGMLYVFNPQLNRVAMCQRDLFLVV
jgi:hypothetical protein